MYIRATVVRGDKAMYNYTYEDIANRYIDTVYRLALSRTKSPEYAEDITQDVFVKFMQTSKKFGKMDLCPTLCR